MTFYDWIHDTNNPKLKSSEYLYNTRHILVLVSVLILIILLSVLFAKRSEKAKRTLLKVGAYILLFFEITSRVVNLIIEENLTLERVAKIILPMHICSVIVWVFIIAIFTNKKFLINFATIGGFLATIAFLLYPSVGLNKVYMSFTCLYSTISHSIGFVVSILLMTLGFAKFNFKEIWKTFLCFSVMFLWGALLDFVIFKGSNYMYLIEDPLELKLNFPYHFIYGAILIVYISLYYFVPLVYGKINKKINTKNEIKTKNKTKIKKKSKAKS